MSNLRSVPNFAKKKAPQFLSRRRFKSRPAHYPEKLERLIRKFDPVERDFRNRALGKAGEEFVLDLERKSLSQHDRSDLAKTAFAGFLWRTATALALTFFHTIRPAMSA